MIVKVAFEVDAVLVRSGGNRRVIEEAVAGDHGSVGYASYNSDDGGIEPVCVKVIDVVVHHFNVIRQGLGNDRIALPAGSTCRGAPDVIVHDDNRIGCGGVEADVYTAVNTANAIVLYYTILQGIVGSSVGKLDRGPASGRRRFCISKGQVFSGSSERTVDGKPAGAVGPDKTGSGGEDSGAADRSHGCSIRPDDKFIVG